MLANISIGQWGADLGIGMVFEKIWKLLQELDMEKIHSNCKQVTHIYMNEAMFDKIVKLWIVEMMKKNE